MRRNRKMPKKMSVMAGRSVQIGALIITGFAMVILNMLASSSCKQLSKTISEKERQLAKLENDQKREQERKESIMTAFEFCNTDGKTTIKDLTEYTGTSEKTVKRHLKEHGGFWIDGNEVGLKNSDKVE